MTGGARARVRVRVGVEVRISRDKGQGQGRFGVGFRDSFRLRVNTGHHQPPTILAIY